MCIWSGCARLKKIRASGKQQSLKHNSALQYEESRPELRTSSYEETDLIKQKHQDFRETLLNMHPVCATKVS